MTLPKAMVIPWYMNMATVVEIKISQTKPEFFFDFDTIIILFSYVIPR